MLAIMHARHELIGTTRTLWLYMSVLLHINRLLVEDPRLHHISLNYASAQPPPQPHMDDFFKEMVSRCSCDFDITMVCGIPSLLVKCTRLRLLSLRWDAGSSAGDC